MVNFGPLAAEIVSLVWGTPGNFNGFRFLAALLHGTLVVGVSQTAALNRGRHLYSAGRPSRWALAHISSFIRMTFCQRYSQAGFTSCALNMMVSIEYTLTAQRAVMKWPQLLLPKTLLKWFDYQIKPAFSELNYMQSLLLWI